MPSSKEKLADYINYDSSKPYEPAGDSGSEKLRKMIFDTALGFRNKLKGVTAGQEAAAEELPERKK